MGGVTLSNHGSLVPLDFFLIKLTERLVLTTQRKLSQLRILDPTETINQMTGEEASSVAKSKNNDDAKAWHCPNVHYEGGPRENFVVADDADNVAWPTFVAMVVLAITFTVYLALTIK